MSDPVADFGKSCSQLLKDKPTSAALEEIRAGLERDLLTNPTVINAHLSDDAAPERKILYEDQDLGFCILAHNYQGAKHSTPHDHGPTWAIYGQVAGTTAMTEYTRVEKPTADAPGKVKPAKTYELRPGMAAAYEVGVLHAPSREATTKLIRIEGKNLIGVKRDKYVCE